MRGVRPFFIAITVAGLSVSACTVSLPGGAPRTNVADADLKELTRRAIRHQDQDAQVELGMRYEYGRGVPVNWKMAARLYDSAATTTHGGLLGPPPSLHGGIAQIAVGRKGSPEAKAHLEALRAKMKAAGWKCDGVGWKGLFCREK